MAVIKEYRGRAPRLESPAFLAETAAIVGDVTLKRGTSVYYSAVLRADSGSITVGENTNIQDGAVLHTAAGHDVCVGCGVTIGHCALVHGCTVEETHFHEVGNGEALRNVLAICLAVEALDPDEIAATRVQTGSGTVRCAHGELPIPAPATAAIIARGIPTCERKLEGERCTPTSAAVILHFVQRYDA